MYKQELKAWHWKKGVNEKTFPAKPSPDNPVVAFEHDGKSQTDDCCMFNMILQDGTRSDNPMTYDDGTVY